MSVIALRAIAASLALLVSWAPGMSLGDADQADLVRAVQAFLHEAAGAQGDEVVIEVRPPAARLGACEAPQPFLPREDAEVLGRLSVGVRCGEQGHQVRYLQAEVGVMGEYPVAVEAIVPGTEATPALLETRRGNLAELPRGAVRDAQALVGQVARRHVAPGRPIHAQAFAFPALVERGQAVEVEARGARFRITREGEALDAGGQGERVRVRVHGRELIEARVVGEGRLSVDF